MACGLRHLLALCQETPWLAILSFRGFIRGPITRNFFNGKVPVGTLVIDMYDTSSEHLVWRGLAYEQLSDKPDKDTKKLEKAVDKLFDKFPPRSM
jgi:hypothetical protein